MSLNYARESCMEGSQKSHVSAGPWGGDCGTRWDDSVYCSIRQIIISHGAVIDAIQIEYDTKGCAVWSEKHGGGGGVKTAKVKLDYPEEYLISISGYYGNIYECGPVVVRSLLLESNKKRYGPFGFQKGTHFSFALTGGKIVGFHGRSGQHLDSIGVYLTPFVTVKSGQPQVTAQNRMGAGVGGSKGIDVMLAVREKMDNMLISNSTFGEYERKDKVFTTTEAVKGSSYQKQIGREKENYTFMPKPSLGETDEAANNHKVFTTSEAVKGSPNMRQVGRERENYMFAPNVPAFSENDETNNNHKLVFPAGSQGKGYSPNARQPIRQKDDYMVEYETMEKVYGTAGREKDYSNMRQSESNMFFTNKIFGEYETKDKLYATPQNTKGSPNGRPAVSCGPWGGNGGMLFDDGVYTGVREIHLSRSGGVVYIKVCYDMNGQAVWGNKNGGSGGFRLDKITFDYPNEFLTHISGYYASTIFRGPTVIKSLTFYTNKNKYGPFGEEQGIPFSSGQRDGIIVGFHGRKGLFLDSIGVHFLEGKHSLPRPFFDMYSTTTDMRYGDQKVISGPAKGLTPCGPGLLRPGMVKEPAPCGPGPWGGDGGSPWDDGVFTGIRKIFLTKGEAIYAIQIEYDRNGQSMWSVEHGTNNEGSCHVIQLEYPHEVLTCISGYYGPVRGDECKKVVKSLTFHTNRGMYGPFGEETGTYFTSAKTEGKIVGFHGKSGYYLYAIGVHTQHLLNDRVEQGPIKMMLNKIFS